MDEAEELVDLVRAHGAGLADLPRDEQDDALAAIRAQHEDAGLRNGMDRVAARAMASRLDGWIREALDLGATNARPSATVH